MVDGENPDFDVDAIVDETLAGVAVRDAGDGTWTGDAPNWFGDRLFGGFVVSQAIHAATRTAPPGTRIHSLHGYFLRAMVAGKDVAYDVRHVRDGRTFSSRHVTSAQDGATTFEALCSFTTDTEGYEYQLPLREPVPPPDELPVQWGPGPWVMAWVGQTEPDAHGVIASTHRAWMRMGKRLDDDAADHHMHSSLLGFASDVTGTGGRPRHLGEPGTVGMVSLDHAIWFHRPWRVDEWALYDVTSTVNAGGRGLLRGTFYSRDGDVIATVAQEMLLRVV